MSNIRYWRVFKLTGLSLVAVILIALSFLFANGAMAQNNAPIISSEPTLVVTTDQIYSYTVNSTDIDNDEVTFVLTTSPDGMTIDSNIITWSPTITGMYSVVLQATDGNNGFDSQSWQIKVQAGEVRSIEVTPNDRPTIMEQDKTAQFSAKAYDNNNNLIEGAEFTWTADDEFTTVDDNGLVTAVKPGTGFVKANIGDIQSAPGIIVQSAAPTDESINDEADENTATEISNSSEDVNELVDTDSGDPELLTSMELEDEEGDEKEVCEENINHSLSFILLIIYAVILVIYFLYEKKNKSPNWWIFPLLITFIGLIIYYRYFCPQTYLWWPWVMVIIGVIVTGYYKGRTESEDDISKNELPF